MKLIVGLGNPGGRYEKTRHNLGFHTAEKFLKDFKPLSNTEWTYNNKLKCDIVKFNWQPKHGKLKNVILVKPKTFMNDSGLCVRLVSGYFKIEPENMLIVHDEVDLPLGNLKIRFGGSAAGHKGVNSIIEKLNTDKFWRLRLGIGHPRLNTREKTARIKLRGVDRFVTSEFGRGEIGKVKELVKRASKAIQEILENNFEAAMNRYNSR